MNQKLERKYSITFLRKMDSKNGFNRCTIAASVHMIDVSLSAITWYERLAAACSKATGAASLSFVRLLCVCGSVADLDVARTVSATHMPLNSCFFASPA
jgi:hypothetical protein